LDALNYFDQALELDSVHKLAVTNKLSLLKKLEEIGVSLGAGSKQYPTEDNTMPLVRRLGRNIPLYIKFQDKVMRPSTIPNILTNVLEELLILRPDIINNLDSKYLSKAISFYL